jgi:hypothetical protein
LPSPADHRTARQEPRYDPRHDDRDRERRRESYRTRGGGEGLDRPSTRDTRSAYSYGATPRPEGELEDRAASAEVANARRLGVRDPLPVRGKETDTSYDATGASKYDPEYSDDTSLPEHAEEVLADAQPRRGRMGIVIVAAVVGIAIVGTAGVFGYRAVFGPTTGGKPPVIGPQAGPNKVAPATPATPESTKQFTDRVAGPSERSCRVTRRRSMCRAHRPAARSRHGASRSPNRCSEPGSCQPGGRTSAAAAGRVYRRPTPRPYRYRTR